MAMSAQYFIPVAKVEDVVPGGITRIEVRDHSILLCHSEGRIFAVINRCSHAQEELACGRVKAGWIACPAHGARFDLETGEAMNPPATEAIRTYAVRIVDDMIEVLV